MSSTTYVAPPPVQHVRTFSCGCWYNDSAQEWGPCQDHKDRRKDARLSPEAAK